MKFNKAIKLTAFPSLFLWLTLRYHKIINSKAAIYSGVMFYTIGEKLVLAGYLGNYSRYEIEKKFLLKQLPDALPDYYVDIKDLYLVDSSLRLRIEKSPSGEIVGRKLTKKDKATDIGHETSIITSLYLSENDFISLGTLTGASLIKRRYALETSNRRIVYDVFQGELTGLIMAEVEFKDHDSLLSFEQECLSWKDVTNNPDYSGGKLAFGAAEKAKT